MICGGSARALQIDGTINRVSKAGGHTILILSSSTGNGALRGNGFFLHQEYLLFGSVDCAWSRLIAFFIRELISVGFFLRPFTSLENLARMARFATWG